MGKMFNLYRSWCHTPTKNSAGHSPGRGEGECSPGVGGGSPVHWCSSCNLQLVDLSDLTDFKRK